MWRRVGVSEVVYCTLAYMDRSRLLEVMMVEDGVEVVVKSGVAEGGGNEPRAFIDSFLLYEP